MSKRPIDKEVTHSDIIEPQPKFKLLKEKAVPYELKLSITKHNSLDVYIEKVNTLIKGKETIVLNLQSKENYIAKLVSLVESIKLLENYEVDMEFELIDAKNDELKGTGSSKRVVPVLKVMVELELKG